MQFQKKLAIDIFKAGLNAVDPYSITKSNLVNLPLDKYNRVNLIAFGKAAYRMALAARDSLGDNIYRGVVITKYGHAASDRIGDKIKVFEAGHPVPDANGIKATDEAIGLLNGSDEDTLVLCLISGGGSALLARPKDGISLNDKQSITNDLLRAGADIHEINAVRKHISMVKGGQLASIAKPAHVLSLIMSDVIGDDLDAIASGPTSPDISTFNTALDVIKKYDLAAPANIIRHLKAGAMGNIPETPKPGDEIFNRVRNKIIASNRICLDAAKLKAESLGYKTVILTDSLKGDVNDAAKWLVDKISEYQDRPFCLLSGGETTVNVKGTGKGGRNMELALRVATMIDGIEGATFLSAGTDGTDGPTDAAGAVVDSNTIKALDPDEFLNNNDSYGFFRRTGELLITGPTGTNVMDVQVMLLN